MASKLPNIKKFKGDNEISFSLWIMQFEAQIRALNITDDNGKWRNVLLCCTESLAFTAISELILADHTITYADLKTALTGTFCGAEYKRNLETKLRSLSWKKGVNKNIFIHELKTCIKDLYGINDQNTINALAMNQVVNNLEESMRKEAKIFQLHGSTNLESLIEFLETRCHGNEFELPNVPTRTAAAVVDNDRIGKLENMVTNLCKKIDDMSTENKFENRQEITCSVCKKSGHDRSRCFKTKTCFKCKQVGHISRFCRSEINKAGDTSSSESKGSLQGVVTPTPRLVMKLKICDTDVDFLYDPGSQVTIMTRKAFDSLKFKPPLQEINKTGTGVDGSSFRFEGIAYLNITFPVTDSKESYTLEYEPILISSQVTTCIYGAQTEGRFKNCIRDLENSTISYTTKDSKNVSVTCYREKVSATTAYVKVAKVTVIPDGCINFVKGRVLGHKGFNEGGILLNIDEIEDFDVVDLKLDKVGRTVRFPVINNSGSDLKLKKGRILAEIREVEETLENSVYVAGVGESDFEFEDLDIGDLEEPEKSKINEIVSISAPQNVNELRCFLGMAGFFRKFVPGFAERSSVLFDLLKKGVKFDWSRECETNFNYVKEKLIQSTLLVHPDYSKPFIILTDASNKAIGFTLTQQGETGLETILYGGRTLNDSERRYCVTDKELLGIFYAVKKCEFYLTDNDVLFTQITNR